MLIIGDQMETSIGRPTAICISCSAYDSRLLVARMIAAEGFELVITEHSNTVFEQIERLPRLDLIVLDKVNTKEQFEYYAQIKSNLAVQHVTLIAILAKDSFDDNLLEKLGADKYIFSPVDIDEFKNILRDYLTK